MPVLIAVILEGFSKSCGSYEMLIAGRFFIGFNSGYGSNILMCINILTLVVYENFYV